MKNAMDETGTAVTKVIYRIPREGMDAQLEQAMKNLIAAALKFRGHLGVTVTRPSLPAQPGFRMVYRFDSCEHLRAWKNRRSVRAWLPPPTATRKGSRTTTFSPAWRRGSRFPRSP